MKPLIKAAAILSVAALGMSGLASCSSAASTSGHARRRPVYGGTLRVISNAGPGSLDPVPTYNYAGYELERGYARQLVTYPTTSPATAPGAAWASATTLVPDVATQVPTVANGGVTGNGLVYTYHLRTGVDWNSSPPRQVTAADFIREFQAFCNPGQFPVGQPSYFTSAIAGFASYCAAESSHFNGQGRAAVTAAAVAAWQDSHQISGLSAPGPLTLRVTLTQPAGDFNNIMALPFVSASPAEYDAYLPGSAGLNQHIMSDGPYQVSSYTPGKQIVLTRNPAWRQSTDPVRHQYVKQGRGDPRHQQRPDGAGRPAGEQPGPVPGRPGDPVAVHRLAAGRPRPAAADLAEQQPQPVHHPQPALPQRRRRDGQARGPRRPSSTGWTRPRSSR